MNPGHANLLSGLRCTMSLLHGMHVCAVLCELLGGFPTGDLAYQTILLEENELPDYSLQKVAVQSEANVHIPCYVLTPRHVQPPYRAVVALHVSVGLAEVWPMAALHDTLVQRKARYIRVDPAGQAGHINGKLLV